MEARDSGFLAIMLILFQADALHAEPNKNEVSIAEKSKITLNANANVSDWVDDESQLSWAIALSEQNILKAISQQGGETYNQPSLSVDGLTPFIVLQGVKNGGSATFEINAGIYDWVILVDIDGDAKPDSYIGSLAEDIQLDQHHFIKDKHYYVDIEPDGRLQYRVE